MIPTLESEPDSEHIHCRVISSSKTVQPYLKLHASSVSSARMVAEQLELFHFNLKLKNMTMPSH
jgi:hypothetical protein